MGILDDMLTLAQTLWWFINTMEHLSKDLQAAANDRGLLNKAALLKQQHEQLARIFQTHGLDESPKFRGIPEIMIRTEKSLQKGTKRLKNLRNSSNPNLRQDLLIGIEIDLNAAEKAYYASVVTHLKEQSELQKVMANIGLQSFIGLPYAINSESEYVPLTGVEETLFVALKSPSRVILLHGGVGTGKSTLARQISLNYARELYCDNAVILECGPKATLSSTKTQLLGRLLQSKVTVTTQIEGDDPGPDGPLAAHLKVQNLLLLLDDVWEPEVIHGILHLCGARVKILITSRRSAICEKIAGADLKSVMMAQPHFEESMRILAIHAGFANGIIPYPFQDVASSIVREGDFNPLVLSTLASRIRRTNNSMHMWQEAKKNIYELLRKGLAHPAAVHGVSYEGSMWSSSEMSVKAVHADARQLLVLIAMSRPSRGLAEFAILYLYRVINESNFDLFDYEELLHQLRDHHLVDAQQSPGEGNLVFVSICSVTRALVTQSYQDTVSEITRLLRRSSSSNPVLSILVDLYMDRTFTENMAAVKNTLASADLPNTSAAAELSKTEAPAELSKTEAPAELRKTEGPELREIVSIKGMEKEITSADDPEITSTEQATEVKEEKISSAHVLEIASTLVEETFSIDGKTIIIAPLMGLLVVNLDDDSTVHLHMTLCVEQVLSNFLQKNSLDLDSISTLLKSSRAFEAVVMFLKQLCLNCMSLSFWESNSPFGGSSPLLISLVDIIDQSQHQDKVLDLLCEMAGYPINARAIGECGGIISKLSFLLEKSSDEYVRKRAVLVFSMCASEARNSDWDGTFMVVSEDASRILRGLTMMLGEPQLAHSASYALINLARMERFGIGNRIITEPHFLEHLVRCLTEYEEPTLISLAACMCARLTATGNLTICEAIGSYPGLRDKLARALEEALSSTQKHAARALSNLVATSSDTRGDSGGGRSGYLSRLFSLGRPRPLDQKFAQLIVHSKVSKVKAAAIRGLINLTHVGDNPMRKRLTGSTKLLTTLTEFFAHSQIPVMKEDVICLLGNLACSRDKGMLNKMTKSFPNFVRSVAKLLVEEQGNLLQVYAIRLLLNISASEKQIDPCDTAEFLPLLQRLQTSVLKKENCPLRELLRVSLTDDEVCGAVDSTESLLQIRDFIQALREGSC